MPLSTTVVPQNWARIFNIKTELNPGVVNDMFLTFIAYTPPKIKVTNIAKENLYDVESAQPVEQFRFFQPKDNIVERINHIYAENPSKVLEGLSGFRELVGKGTGFGLQIKSGGTQGSLFEEPFLYTKTDRRTFSIVLSLYAYSDLDKDVYDPIDFFRRYSYPSQFIRKGETDKPIQGGGIQFPHVFKIRGGVFKLNTHQDETFFALNDLDIDYNPEVKFLKAGFPIQANLTLNFTEISQMYANKFPRVKISTLNTNDKDVTNLDALEEISGPEAGNSPMASIKKNFKNNIQNSINSITSIADIPPEHLLEITGLLKPSTLTGPINSITSQISSELKAEIDKVVKESGIQKQITSLTSLPQEHLNEVKKILKKITI